MLLPDTIHHHARSERILGAGQSLRELQSAIIGKSLIIDRRE